MSFEEEFDRIIRQKTKEADFPFDEKNWEKARHLLDVQRRVPGAGNNGKFYAGAVLILCLGIGGWLLINPGQEAVVSIHAVAPGKKMAGIVPTQPSAMPIAESVSLPEKNSAEAVTPFERTPSNSSQAPSVENAAVKTNYHPEEKLADQQLKAGDDKIQAPSTGQTPASDAAEKTSGKNDDSPAQALEKKPAIFSASEITGSTEKADQENVTAAQQTDPSAGTEAMSYEPLSLLASPQATLAEAELLPVPFNHFNIYDEDYYKLKKFKTHFLNVEAGSSYLAGWDTKSGKDGKGFNWFGGINYGIYLSKKIALGLGVQMYNISNISQPFYTATKTDYGFGVTSTSTVVTSNSLYYAAVPVKFYYKINPQNQFGIGANVGMLVSSKNTVESYGLSDNVKVNAVKNSNMGVYQGINTTNIQLSAFYRTQVGKRLYLNGEILYSVSTIFQDPSTKEHVLGGRLSLQYTLFDR